MEAKMKKTQQPIVTFLGCLWTIEIFQSFGKILSSSKIHILHAQKIKNFAIQMMWAN